MRRYTVRLLGRPTFQAYYGSYPCTILQEQDNGQSKRYFVEFVDEENRLIPGWVSERAIKWKRVK